MKTGGKYHYGREVERRSREFREEREITRREGVVSLRPLNT